MILLSPPDVDEHERQLLLEAFDSNWIAPLGPQVDAFEAELASKLGVENAVALASGTAGLHLALLLLGVAPGDEVIVSTLTFVASANAITYTGARPVFVDSEAVGWNMDPHLLEEELADCARRGKLPKAVIVVDLCGACADYDKISRICARYEVPIVEDAAGSLGATYRDRPAGSFGDFGIFSFNGNKIITTGGGGMLLAKRKDWADRARSLASQARPASRSYDHIEIGYNYRLSNLLAALGRAQLGKLDDFVAKRRANNERYRKLLADVPGISFRSQIAHSRPTYWLTAIQIEPNSLGATRDELISHLQAQRIEARAVWKPMHLQPFFAHCRVRGGAVAADLFRHGVLLPSGSSLTQDQQYYIAEQIKNVPTAASPTQKG